MLSTHPPFISVAFYPGYSYSEGGSSICSAPGRYIGLTEDGRVYVYMVDGSCCWNEIT